MNYSINYKGFCMNYNGLFKSFKSQIFIHLETKDKFHVSIQETMFFGTAQMTPAQLVFHALNSPLVMNPVAS